MKILEFKKSTRDTKKYMVVLEDNEGKKHTIHFGQRGFQDFTQHHDENRKKAYISRHGAREDFSNSLTPGFWARWILWNKPTVEESLKDTIKRFHLEH